MWSSRYKYYQIRKDKVYSECVDTQVVRSIILENEHIEPDGKLSFKSQEGCPWISMTMIKTEDGNYSVDERTFFEEINLIEVITSRGNEDNENWYLGLLKVISKKLNWEVRLEQDDEGKEGILIE